MLFLARMDVTFPAYLTAEEVTDFQVREKAYSAQLQQSGKMQGLWRIVGEYANHSLFNVESNDELHQILSGFPMYAHMKLKVTPLAKHPNSLS
ncbi:muconolactone Delta-isomerase family protein [Glutamicibacter sp. AOP33-2CA-4]|uniref:muconolactone Delta-isomerase family protein n=1 Tax=Glutamicibacter sp. AOP33-2CA-4 TaxID=3457690 RepID=UPI004034D90A